MNEERIFDIAPGEKYEDNRSRLKIFFQVLGRKFWKLITVNFMYILFNIPALILSFFLGIFILEFFMPQLVANTPQEGLFATLLMVSLPLVMFLMAIPVISVGPAQAGLTYLLRCYSYEIPTFTWSDFKDKMKDNMKQGIAASFINLFMLVFLLFDFFLYSRINTESNVIFTITSGLLIVIFILFLMVCMYVYPMMVTYVLSLKNIYRNAVLFAFAKFLPNLGILLLCLILVLGPIIIVQFTASVLALTISYVYYTILGFTLPGLIVNFYINPVIDKYLRPADPENGQKEAQEGQQ